VACVGGGRRDVVMSKEHRSDRALLAFNRGLLDRDYADLTPVERKRLLRLLRQRDQGKRRGPDGMMEE